MRLRMVLFCAFVLLLIYGSISLLLAANEPLKPLPAKKVNPKDGAKMMLIPAGEFQMGASEDELAAWLKTHPTDTSEQFANELPRHGVYLDAFYMYANEVTVAQYRKFCRATKRAMPSEPDWKWKNTHPIVNVVWEDAAAYAAWAGAALPSEAQWEKAARCGDGRLYPWGNAWPPPAKAGNFPDQALKATEKYPSWPCIDGYADGFAYTSPVGSFPANPYGLHDLAGNVWEWCADWYDADYYRNAPLTNPTGPVMGTTRVLRGGGWGLNYPRDCRTTFRGNGYLTSRGDDFGFRCVVRLPAPVRTR